MKKSGINRLRALCALAGTALLPAIALAQPANDTCLTATAASIGANNGDSTGAVVNTSPAGTCLYTSQTEDVWWTFTNTGATDNFQIDLIGSAGLDDDGGLLVYSACGGTLLACNDDISGSDYNARLTMSVANMQTVYIRVSGYGNVEGPYVLNINPVVISNNESCLGAEALTIGTPSSGDNTAAATDGSSPPCSFGDANDLWYKFTAPGPLARSYKVTVTPTSLALDGVISAHTDCGQTTTVSCADSTLDGDPEVMTFAGTPGTTYYIRVAAYDDAFGGGTFAGPFDILVEDNGSLLANDACSGAIAISTGSPGSGDTSAASSEGVTASCTAGIKDQWFTFTAPTAGPASGVWVFSVDGPAGNSVSLWSACGGTELACNLADAGFIASAGVTLNDGDTVKIRVAGFGDAANTFTVSVAEVPAPANDACANAELIASLPAAATPVLIGATDDTDVACNAAAATSLKSAVWYSFTPADSGELLIGETSASDVVIALYTGTCGGLAEVACSDAEPSSFTVTSGTPYLIAVGLYSATSSASATPLALTFEMPLPPDNDDCESAEALVTSPVTVDGRGAADDAIVSPTCDAGSAGANNGVWYSYSTGVDGGNLVLSETSANDVIMAVYSGTCGSLTQVSCSDAETNFSTALAANTNYFVLVSMWSAATSPSAPYSMTFAFTAATGACCDAGSCSISTASACGGSFQGANVPCFGSGTPTGATYASTDTFPLAIPDDDLVTGVSSTVTIAGSGVTIGAAGIAVNVGLTHTWGSDVTLTLTNGTNTVTIVEDTGNFDSTNLGAVYTMIDGGADMGAVANGLATGDIIPAGLYQPFDANGTTSLATTFSGQSLDGTWTLTAYDAVGSDTGTIDSFSIQNAAAGAPTCPTGPTPCQVADFDDNNAVSVNDLFAFLSAWFAQNGQSGPGLSADVDANNAVSVNDLFVFLALWFQYNGTSC